MATVENLFVYGVWCEGGPLFDMLKPYVDDLAGGYILGEAYRTSVGYPVYVSDGSDLIPGQVATVRGPDVLWRLLEEFHGVQPMNPRASLFHRASRTVFDLAGASKADAEVFSVSRHLLEAKWGRISGGDWRRDLVASPPLPERMTDRQKTYIRRLGQSTGREIVPIDLELYRELMKLELIVDKGRRLALSSLGRELLKFL
jgi:hypothetical protein